VYLPAGVLSYRLTLIPADDSGDIGLRVLLWGAETVCRAVEFPDGPVQSADGVVDRANGAVIADEAESDVQVQACAEQLVSNDGVQVLGDPGVIFGQMPDGRGWADHSLVRRHLLAGDQGTAIEANVFFG
jgi:hypothetical protein